MGGGGPLASCMVAKDDDLSLSIGDVPLPSLTPSSSPRRVEVSDDGDDDIDFDTLKRATLGLLMRGGENPAASSFASASDGGGGVKSALSHHQKLNHGEAAEYLAAVTDAVTRMPPEKLSASLDYVLFPVNRVMRDACSGG